MYRFPILDEPEEFDSDDFIESAQRGESLGGESLSASNVYYLPVPPKAKPRRAKRLAVLPVTPPQAVILPGIEYAGSQCERFYWEQTGPMQMSVRCAAPGCVVHDNS